VNALERMHGTFGGIANRAHRAAGVQSYSGAVGPADGIRRLLMGSWAACLRKHKGKPPGLLLLHQTEVAGYFWARHGTEAARCFAQHAQRDALTQVFPQLPTLLAFACQSA
jgi:hypothetical protein